MKLPRCPKCGEPARIVVLSPARVRCQLNADGTPGKILSALWDKPSDQSFECGGQHTWKEP
jgi:hypothetical protein